MSTASMGVTHIFNGLLALVLLFLGWGTVELSIFSNALILLFLVLFPLQVALLIWRVFRKMWVNLFAKNIREHVPFKLWAQIANGCLFYGLAIAILEIRVLPFQFTPEEYSGIRWTFWLTGLGLIVLQFFPGKRVFLPTNLVVLAASVFIILQIISIYRPIPESEGIVISSPVRGEWGVVQGGASSIVNHHYNLVEQRDALDLVKLVDGRENVGDAEKLEDYPSWGAPIYAPAAGEVVAAVADRADNSIGDSDRKYLAGNFVTIEIGPERFVFLCHLKKGSLLVKAGDQVVEGQPLAACGNSGNTSAPHLHIQVQNKADVFAEGGRTYPMFIRGISVKNRERPRDGTVLNLRANDVILPNERKSE